MTRLRLFYQLTCSVPTGDVLDVLEQRHDWARFNFTLELFKYVFTVLIPDVISHNREQDQDQVRGHYDREPNFSVFTCHCTHLSIF